MQFAPRRQRALDENAPNDLARRPRLGGHKRLAEQFRGRNLSGGGRFRPPDSASVRAATGMDLRLDQHRATETLRNLAGLPGGDRDTALRRSQPVACQEVLRLELMDSHDPVPPVITP